VEYHLTLPLNSTEVTTLHIGDVVYVSGTLFTARDEAHHVMLEKDRREIPFDPSKMALYHCGPLMKKSNNTWEVVSAGPTTSSRMELFEDQFIEKFGITLIIGKGGMGDQTRQALQKHHTVYTSFTGGAGALAAENIDNVTGVYWLDELGMPEAVWILKVTRFGPLIVAMDAHGESLYKKREGQRKS
jgi:tartrate/fumarate subfamily iron-sulfur-dependent hydro-lyase beta chain